MLYEFLLCVGGSLENFLIRLWVPTLHDIQAEVVVDEVDTAEILVQKSLPVAIYLTKLFDRQHRDRVRAYLHLRFKVFTKLIIDAEAWHVEGLADISTGLHSP